MKRPAAKPQTVVLMIHGRAPAFDDGDPHLPLIRVPAGRIVASWKPMQAQGPIARSQKRARP